MKNNLSLNSRRSPISGVLTPVYIKDKYIFIYKKHFKSRAQYKFSSSSLDIAKRSSQRSKINRVVDLGKVAASKNIR